MLTQNYLKRQLLPSEKKQVKDALSKLQALALINHKQADPYLDAMEQLAEMYPDAFGEN